MAKFIGETGLVYLWAKIKGWVAGYTSISESSGTKTLTVGNTSATLPTKTSQLTNDSGYITSSDVPEGAVASSTTPLMDGTAAVGTETAFARGDHRHPTDTSRVAANAAITGATKTKITYDSKGLVTAGDDLVASDIPSITLSKISDVTATAAEVNVLDGITASTAELNYVDGVTSAIQTQLNGKADIVSEGTAGNLVALDSNGNIIDAGVSASSAGTDTTNTTGGDDTSSKIYLVGMTSQTASDGSNRTYTQDTAYVGTDGCLYSNSSKVITTAQVGAASGVCPLDSGSKIDASYLPGYVDDVVEAYIRNGQTALSSTWLATGSATGTVITPETGKIYVIMNGDSTYAANTEFRWGGTTYVQLNDSGCTEMTTAEMDTATNNWT